MLWDVMPRHQSCPCRAMSGKSFCVAFYFVYVNPKGCVRQVLHVFRRQGRTKAQGRKWKIYGWGMVVRNSFTNCVEYPIPCCLLSIPCHVCSYNCWSW